MSHPDRDPPGTAVRPSPAFTESSLLTTDTCPLSQPATRGAWCPAMPAILASPASVTVATPPQLVCNRAWIRTAIPMSEGEIPMALARSRTPGAEDGRPYSDHPRWEPRPTGGSDTRRRRPPILRPPLPGWRTGPPPRHPTGRRPRPFFGRAGVVRGCRPRSAPLPSCPGLAAPACPRRMAGTEASTGTTNPSGTGNPIERARASPAALAPTSAWFRASASPSPDQARRSRHALLVDGDYLVGLVRRDHLDSGVRHVQHFLETDPESMEYPVLGLQGERHTWPDLHRMIQ